MDDSGRSSPRAGTAKRFPLVRKSGAGRALSADGDILVSDGRTPAITSGSVPCWGGIDETFHQEIGRRPRQVI